MNPVEAIEAAQQQLIASLHVLDLIKAELGQPSGCAHERKQNISTCDTPNTYYCLDCRQTLSPPVGGG